DLVDTIPKMFTDEHTLDYLSPPLYDDVDVLCFVIYVQDLIARILKPRARSFVLRSLELRILSFIMGIQYQNLID
ncbi:hypothetical protein Tco_0207699, partial [Tanacetum coccineum]